MLMYIVNPEFELGQVDTKLGSTLLLHHEFLSQEVFKGRLEVDISDISLWIFFLGISLDEMNSKFPFNFRTAGFYNADSGDT